MAERAGRIVVGYDGSEDAGLALEWAATTAGHLPERLMAIDVVVVSAPVDPVVAQYASVDKQRAKERRRRAEDRLAELGVRDSVVHVRHGAVAPTLIEASDGADILVVGSAGHALVTGTFLGSASQHIARHAKCPVVVVRQQRSPRARRIVVGVDGSPESDAAFRFACERAVVTGETVVGLHGYLLAGLVTHPDGDIPPGSVRTLKAAEALVGDICAGLADKFPEVKIEPEAIPVRPGRALVDASGGASLVVVGSRGRGAFAELLLGSVSQHVLHKAQCPVAVIR